MKIMENDKTGEEGFAKTQKWTLNRISSKIDQAKS